MKDRDSIDHGQMEPSDNSLQAIELNQSYSGKAHINRHISLLRAQDLYVFLHYFMFDL